jgi:chitosanase
VGQLIILDTIVQQGEGDDPDGLPAILHATVKKVGRPIPGNEIAWLDTFLAVRKYHMLHPADPSTGQAWAESVDRVRALGSILHSGNPSLLGKISWKVYGDPYTLPALK